MNTQRGGGGGNTMIHMGSSLIENFLFYIDNPFYWTPFDVLMMPPNVNQGIPPMKSIQCTE